MEIQAYILASKDMQFVAIQQSSHAEIVSLEEALGTNRNILVYTNEGKAKKGLSCRTIYSDVYWDWNTNKSVSLCEKEDLVVTPVKLTLDNHTPDVV